MITTYHVNGIGDKCSQAIIRLSARLHLPERETLKYRVVVFAFHCMTISDDHVASETSLVLRGDEASRWFYIAHDDSIDHRTTHENIAY